MAKTATKKPAAKETPTKKRAVPVEDDDEEETPPPRKQTKKRMADPEDDDEEEETPAARKSSSNGKAVTKTTGTAVARRPQSTALAQGGLLAAMRSEAGRGMETMKQEDLALPFILVLQQLSPQLQKGHEKFIKGAEAGDFLNTVTGEIWKGEDGIFVVPAHYIKVFNEWVPRDEGGGFVASYRDRQEAQMNVTEGNDIVDTANHFVLVWSNDSEEWQECVLSMTSTKLKVSRQWNSRLKQQKLDDGEGGKFTPPSYARQWVFTTVGTKNDKGFFHIPQFEPGDWIDDEQLYEQARSFYAMMAEGGANLSYKSLNVDDVKTGEEDDDTEENF